MLSAQKQYMGYICKAYDMVRDKSRYVILTVNLVDYVWTHCEWFDFAMPSYMLYNWIKDIEPKLSNDEKFKLLCVLNDKTEKYIPKHNDKNANNEMTLKDICASHIMEISCFHQKKSE